MLYTMRIQESLGLHIAKPIILHVDNRGAVNLANNWSVGGRTRFVEISYYLQLELKEKNLIAANWVPAVSNCCDLLTKKFSGPTFEWHVQVFVVMMMDPESLMGRALAVET